MFGRVVIEPNNAREPEYDNIYKIGGRWQKFACINCGHMVPVDIEDYVGKGADPGAVCGTEHALAIERHFGRVDKSLRNGWPKYRVELCPHCSARYVVYVAEFEPRNGWRQGSIQGVTELIE